MFTENRHAAGLCEIPLETSGTDVSQVVGMGALGKHVLLGARHSNIEGFVHGKTPAGILTVSSLSIVQAGVVPCSAFGVSGD
jgi:hypothetical protein